LYKHRLFSASLHFAAHSTNVAKQTSMKFLVTVAFLLLGSALCNNEVSNSQSLNNMTLGSMEKVFLRSEKDHQASMVAITKSITVAKAAAMLKKSPLATKELAEVTSMVLKGGSHLRKQPKGYSGLEGARKMLNDMIYESMSKYDAEIAKCTEYYSKQCAAMEVCRGQISASNFIASNSRALILDSQSTINRCETDIPTTKLELKEHNSKCAHELQKMNDRLKIVLGDISTMTTILKMTDCDANKDSFLQGSNFDMLHCTDQCTKKSFVEFKDRGLQEKLAKLQSSVSHNLMHDMFADVDQTPLSNKTSFANPPLPKTEVPGDPCTDPDMGAPSAANKRAAKCVLSGAKCYKLQERFLLIQSGIQDERDDLMWEISNMENLCQKTRQTLETEVKDDEQMLDDAQTKLAGATEKEATAGETARQTATKHEQLNNDLVSQMKTCSDNYINFEGELCALKKIRGELYKMKGGSDAGSAFFQDCEVSAWDPEECTKVCAGGDQKLSRSVLVHPNGGAKCLPLGAERRCNEFPCPVDCKLHDWSEWSKCSAECGGGVQQRLREVKQAMKYGGKPCGKTSQAQACNPQACEKDCDLSSWSDWGACSKNCDGGTKKRSKFVKKQPEGEGECAGQWSSKRLQYKQCSMTRCKTASLDKPMGCAETLDVVLLIDGSGSLGKKGWNAEIKAAQTFVDAFAVSDGKSKANLAVILYSGPRTWGGVYKCMGKKGNKVDMKKTCKIDTVQHFTQDMKKVKEQITSLKWPQGSTLTSLALMTAKAELGLGRANAKSVVVVITDGRPLSFRKTWFASRALRKSARLVWVPVTRYAPLKYIKKWATRRWQENVVKVNSFGQLAKPEVVTHIMADICPTRSCKCFHCGGNTLFPSADVCGAEVAACGPNSKSNSGCWTDSSQGCQCSTGEAPSLM